jgi:hypothetical protein
MIFCIFILRKSGCPFSNLQNLTQECGVTEQALNQGMTYIKNETVYTGAIILSAISGLAIAKASVTLSLRSPLLFISSNEKCVALIPLCPNESKRKGD